jgi:hypothetical protein
VHMARSRIRKSTFGGIEATGLPWNSIILRWGLAKHCTVRTFSRPQFGKFKLVFKGNKAGVGANRDESGFHSGKYQPVRTISKRLLEPGPRYLVFS